MILRAYEDRDLKRVLELNQDLVHFLSPLSEETFTDLLQVCDYKYVVEIEGKVEGFVLALSEGKNYKSVNYQWFTNHYDHFLYIDRIVVSRACQSKGIGNFIYKKMIEHVKADGYPLLVAEIDVEPANPKSLNFHKKFNFKEVGRQSIYGGKKVVSLQALEIDSSF